MKVAVEAAISKAKKNNAKICPMFFDFSKSDEIQFFEQLLEEGQIRHISDDFEEEQQELFAIRNPRLVYTPKFKDKFAEYYRSLEKEKPLYAHGVWVYFPWSSVATHILSEEEFHLVRTARNRNLITSEEQEKFYNSNIGIGGLSVGSSVAFALALQGAGRCLKLADMDRLALSNTNRILVGVDNLGMLKVEIAARRIYEINPYIKIELFPEGLNSKNIERFFDGLDIVIDELDNLAIKFLIRQHAKKNNIPVIMAADNGDNAVIDIERYDLTPDLAFFHGRLGNVTYEELKSLDKFGIGRTITRHIGPENITIRMQQSLLEMGKSIVSWPQLGGAALINAAAVAYCVRKILNGQPVEENRAIISLDEKLDPRHMLPIEIDKRKQASEVFAKSLGL